jgi:hypothetical protein
MKNKLLIIISLDIFARKLNLIWVMSNLLLEPKRDIVNHLKCWLKKCKTTNRFLQWSNDACKPTHCDYCKAAFICQHEKESLNEKEHSLRQLMICQEFSCKFVFCLNFPKELKDSHLEKKHPICGCKECGPEKRFESGLHLSDHKREIDVFPIVCKYCEDRFVNKLQFIDHAQGCHASEYEACKNCNLRLVDETHKRNHTRKCKPHQ